MLINLRFFGHPKLGVIYRGQLTYQQYFGIPGTPAQQYNWWLQNIQHPLGENISPSQAQIADFLF